MESALLPLYFYAYGGMLGTLLLTGYACWLEIRKMTK